MASPSSPFPALPVCQVTIPSTALINAALAYAKEHTSECTVNHTLRSAAFAMLLLRKFPPLAAAAAANMIDTEAVVVSLLLHDMGWATTKELISADKRFEVDGANIAREFIKKSSSAPPAGQDDEWDKHRVQLVWDSIALHTTPSIAHHKEPEVLITQLGISSDFLGPNLPLPPSPDGKPIITVEELQEIVATFPRLGFSDQVVEILCGFCRDKKDTTFDNFVAGFGKIYGVDGKGGGKEEWQKACEENSSARLLMGGLAACQQWES
jgi:hypothetical protein